MHKLTVQFYATPEDVVEFLRRAMRMGLSVTLVTRVPFSLRNATNETDIDRDMIIATSQVGISVNPIDGCFNSFEAFSDTYYKCLILDIGMLKSGTLHQSILSAQTESEDDMSRWKAVAAIVKKSTTSGVWVANRNTKDCAFYRTFRYTPGALELFDNGCHIASPAGNGIVYLRNPRSA